MEEEIKLPVKEPWLSHIASGKKTVEGRIGDGKKYRKWMGKKALFFNNNNQVMVKILAVRCYPTLYDYLDNEGYQNVLPGVESYQRAVEIYHKFYPDEKIKERGGMCGIVVEVVDQD